jgi:hypothetical protein
MAMPRNVSSAIFFASSFPRSAYAFSRNRSSDGRGNFGAPPKPPWRESNACAKARMPVVNRVQPGDRRALRQRIAASRRVLQPREDRVAD